MKNNIKLISMLFLSISIIFLFPMQIGNVYGSNVNEASKVSQTCGANAGVSNVKGSLVLSILTLCLPGILEKVHDYDQITCQKIQCKYNAVKAGIDPTFCAQQAGYQTCVYIVGEMFAIPPMAFVEYVRDFIANILANPVGLAYGVTVKFARKYVESGKAVNPMASASVILLTVTDALALVEQVQDMMENGFFPPGGDEEDYCDGIEDIAKEMQEIVKYA